MLKEDGRRRTGSQHRFSLIAACWLLLAQTCWSYDKVHIVDLYEVVCSGGSGHFDVELDETQLRDHKYSPHVVTFLRSSSDAVDISFTVMNSASTAWSLGSQTVSLVDTNNTSARLLEQADQDALQTRLDEVFEDWDDSSKTAKNRHLREKSARPRSASRRRYSSSRSRSYSSPPRRRTYTPPRRRTYTPPPRRRTYTPPRRRTYTPPPRRRAYDPRRRGSYTSPPRRRSYSTPPRRRAYVPSPRRRSNLLEHRRRDPPRRRVTYVAPRRRGSYVLSSGPRRRYYSAGGTRWNSAGTGGTSYGYTSNSQWSSSYPTTVGSTSYGYTGGSSYGYSKSSVALAVAAGFVGGAAVTASTYYLYRALSSSSCSGFSCCYGCSNSCYSSTNHDCTITVKEQQTRDDIMSKGFYPDELEPFPLKVRVLSVTGDSYSQDNICPPTSCTDYTSCGSTSTTNTLWVTLTQMEELSDAGISLAHTHASVFGGWFVVLSGLLLLHILRLPKRF